MCAEREKHQEDLRVHTHTHTQKLPKNNRIDADPNSWCLHLHKESMHCSYFVFSVKVFPLLIQNAFRVIPQK